MSIAFGGLASGLDTNGMIDQLMAVESVPRDRLLRQQKVVQARQDQLRDIGTRLRTLRSAAATLQSAATWASTQTVTSGDATKVGATLGSAAGPGGYQVQVTQLARAAQATYTWTPPAAADTIAIGGYSLAVAAGATVDDVAAALNADSASPVYAVNVSGQLVLSSRSTGAASGFTATSASLVLQSSRAGLDAAGTVDGVAFSSSTNTVTTAIPGVSLALHGVTTSAVTVEVGAPGLDKAKVGAAVKAFADAYNAVVTFVQGKLREQRVANPQSDAEALKGVLAGDSMLTGVLSRLRTGLAEPLGGNPAALDELAEIGLSTGASTGSAAVNPDAVKGLLVLDGAKLTAALDSDPASVRRLLAGDGTSTGVIGRITAELDQTAGSGGVLDSRVDSASRQLSTLRDQTTAVERRLTAKRAALERQFAALETALSRSQSQGQWLQGQLATLPGSSG